MKASEAVTTFGETLNELKHRFTDWYGVGVCFYCELFRFICNFGSGSIAYGSCVYFLLAILGWLGVFLTGSDTSSNALFSALQATTAQQIGIPEVLLVAANTSGGVTGKMISPQSIAIALCRSRVSWKRVRLVPFHGKNIASYSPSLLASLLRFRLIWFRG